MGFLDKLRELVTGETTVQSNRAKIDRQMQPLIKKANERNVQKLRSGQINREQYQQKSNEIFNQSRPQVRSLGNGMVANNYKDSPFRTINTGLASGVMNIAPQRILGSIAEYGGTAFGNDSVRDFGTRLNQPFRDFNAVNQEQASNKGLYTGANVVGGLLTLPIAPVKGTGAFRATQYGASSAADTAYAIKQGGGDQRAQVLGGGVMGGVSGYLGARGADKILNPTNKLAASLPGRIAQAGLYEGLEEATESGVQSGIAKTTYDKDLSLKDAAKDAALSFAIGGAFGGALRGGVELGRNPKVQDTAKQTATQVQDKAKPLGATSAQVKADPQYRQFEKRITKAIKNASESTGKLKANYLQEARELIRLRNARVNELTQGGFIGGGKATGFNQAQEQGRVFEGVDGKPRFEVDDSGAYIKQKGLQKALGMNGNTKAPIPLDQLLSHKELFSQYPQLRKVKVLVGAQKSQGKYDKFIPATRGEYNPATNTIVLSGDKATLLHEVQHAIQQIEGFSTGATSQSPEMIKSTIDRIKTQLKQANEKLSSIEKGTNGYREALDNRNNLVKALDNYQDQYGRPLSAEKAYKNNAGEAEARAVASRMNMSDGERYKIPKTADDYAMSHRPDPEGATLDDISQGGNFVPEDVYTNPEWYGDVSDQATRESIATIQKVKGNPEAEVTVYRASPKNELNSGDWISLSKKYAVGESGVEGTKVHSFKVKAKELRWPGDSFNEFGYFPDSKPQSTFYDSLDVPKEDLIIRDGGGKAMSVDSNPQVGSELFVGMQGQKGKYLGKSQGYHQVEVDLPSGGKSVRLLDDNQFAKTLKDQADFASESDKIAKRKQETAVHDKLASEKAIAEKRAKQDLGGFTDGKSDIQKRKIEATLDREIRYDGKVWKKREWVKELLDEGYTPDVNKKRLVAPNGNYFDATLTEVRYADHLQKQSKAMSVEPSKLATETKLDGRIVSASENKNLSDNIRRQLRDVNTVRKQIIEAEVEPLMEANRDKRNVIKEVKQAGGISSSAYETLPKSVKNSKGLSADKVAQELGFDSEDALVEALNNQTKNPTRAELQAQAIENLENGKSQYSSDWQETTDRANELLGEIDTLPIVRKKVKTIPNEPHKPTAQEIDSLLGNFKRTSIEKSEEGLRIVNEEIASESKEVKSTNVIQTSQQPVKDKIDGDFREASNQYLGSLLNSETQARLFADSLPELSKENRTDAIIAIDQGIKTGDAEIDRYAEQFKRYTDNLYAKYRDQGINMGYVESYLPRIYKHPETGAALNAQEYELLQLGSARQKGRNAQKVNPDDLLYKTPEELLGHYVKSMERVVAGRQYLERLEKGGFVTAATQRPAGMKLVDAEGFVEGGMNYYASPKVADSLNKIFGSQPENQGLRKVARLASVAQDIGLSGGVPGTPANAFTFAQLTKEVLAGNFKGPAIALTKSFKRKHAAEYFKQNSDVISEMQKKGIAVSSEYNMKALRELHGDVGDQDGKLARTWDKVMSDPTFRRFIPILQVEMYKTVKQHKNADVAADTVKNFYGLTDLTTQRTRSRNMNNLTTTALFAPKYRESMIRFWVKNARALSPRGNFANARSGEYNQNLKFVAGATVLFGIMQALNVALNGVPTWENPDGKKDKLLIPDLPGVDGKTVGLPFLSSISTVPRNIAVGGYNALTGNFEEAGKNVKSFVSYAGRPVLDLLDNENYFGQRIVDEDDSTGQKVAQGASYLTESYMHPYIREGINLAKNQLPEGVQDFVGARNTTPVQSLSQALETPVRFYDPNYFRGQSDKFVNSSEVRKTEGNGKIGSETVKNESGKVTQYSSLDAVREAFKTKDGNLNVNEFGNEELYNAITDVGLQANSEFKDAGLPELPVDSRIAKLYADYKANSEGKNAIDQAKAQKSFFKSAYKKSYLDGTTESFYTLGDDDMRSEIQSGNITKAQMDKVIALDNLLTAEGLQKYPQVGKILRRELGYGEIESGTGKSSYARRGRSKSSGGSRRKYQFNIPGGFSLLPEGSASSAGSVRNLLANSRVDYRA